MPKMPSEQPRLLFKQLKGFKAIENEHDKIETIAFLNAAREVVALIENFGKLFRPVVGDMNGNIEKIFQVYAKNEIDYQYLDDVLNAKEETIREISAGALLWLTRALEMIETFFSNVLNDKTCSENLKHHIEAAYAVTLKQYHNWFIQKSFAVIYTVLPHRSQLIGKGEAHEENVEALAPFLASMRTNLKRINSLL